NGLASASEYDAVKSAVAIAEAKLREAEAEASDATFTKSFGPVVELMVKEAADLDTGKLAELPESITKKSNITENVLDAVAWMEREGMDVFADTRTHFFGVGMRAIA